MNPVTVTVQLPGEVYEQARHQAAEQGTSVEEMLQALLTRPVDETERHRARAAVQTLLYLLDEAFEGSTWHSLLGNLAPLTPEDWDWVPSGGQRSIRDIIQHVGGSKFMYENHAFGDGSLTWDDPLVSGSDGCATLTAAKAWLQEGHSRLTRSIARLDDTELRCPRMTNWGERKDTRWILSVMIQHDLYHAGEINHIRSQRQKTDRWAYDQS